MAYNDFEISDQDGRALALYLIEWGNTQWRYTSADRPFTRMEIVGDELVEVTYEPRAMKDNGMRQGTSSQNDFQIDGPADLPLVRLFRGSAPTETIWVTVRRVHYDDPVQDAPIYWKGTIWNVRAPGEARSVIICKPLTASLKRTGLRLCYTRECPHFLYDQGCKVDPEAFAVPAEVVAVTATTITVVPVEFKEENWFRGGFLTWTASEEGTLERRMIDTDALDAELGEMTVTIMGLVDFLAAGDTVTMYPGCDRVPTTCNGKFANMDNYGGFDFMPNASPFVGAIW